MKVSNIRLGNKEKLSLFTDITTMLTAGIPILEAVDSLAVDTKGNLKKVFAELRVALVNGEPLSGAMERLPKAFDPVTLNLVRAAEMGGTLEETFQDIVKNTKREMVFSESLRNTMIYPIFVGVIFSGIIMLMLTFVLPRIGKVFLSLKVDIPWTTRIMFTASDYFIAHWIVIILGIIAFMILTGIFVSYNKRFIIRLILGLPGLRKLGLYIDLARFTRSFALLLKAGVPLNDTLLLSERVVQKKQVLAVVKQMKDNVESGKAISDGLRGSKVIPSMMVRSIETAERSGSLEKTMQGMAEYFNDQVESRLKVLTTMIEPVLIIVIGGLVGLLVLTIIAPIYGLMSQINSKAQ